MRDVALTLPDRAWELIKLREGAKGPLAFEFAGLRVWTVRHRRADLFVTQTRRDLREKGKKSELTLDMALRLLRAALPRPQLSLDDAEALVDYYAARNRQATKSHWKKWFAKHLKPVSRK